MAVTLQPEVCRICLELEDPERQGERMLFPCRCQAPVHRSCLDAWRCSGMNPANLTRCEVCQYHYRYEVEGKPRPWKIHILLYCLVFLEIGLFFGVAAALGHIGRATNMVDIIDWGRLSFMRPETSRGWFFFGFCLTCFIIGTTATLYFLVKYLSGRLRRDVDTNRGRRHGSSWSTAARQARVRSRDFCRDMCDGCEDGSFMYLALLGPDCYCMPCEACCGSFDAQCLECIECMNCGDGCADCPACEGCGECGENPCILVLMGCAAVFAVVLIFVGLFFVFWVILVNVFYGVWLHQNYLRDRVAARYRVLDYDVKLDDKPLRKEPLWKPKRSATGLPTGLPPPQEAMPETVGAKDEVSSVNSSAHVVQGNMISTEL